MAALAVVLKPTRQPVEVRRVRENTSCTRAVLYRILSDGALLSSHRPSRRWGRLPSSHEWSGSCTVVLLLPSTAPVSESALMPPLLRVNSDVMVASQGPAGRLTCKFKSDRGSP